MIDNGNKLINKSKAGGDNVPAEKELERATVDVERGIKVRLLERHMTLAELSRLLNINRQQVNRAIKGDNTPKAKEIRDKIYRVLDM